MENSLAKEYYANGDVYYHAWRMGIYTLQLKLVIPNPICGLKCVIHHTKTKKIYGRVLIIIHLPVLAVYRIIRHNNQKRPLALPCV